MPASTLAFLVLGANQISMNIILLFQIALYAILDSIICFLDSYRVEKTCFFAYIFMDWRLVTLHSIEHIFMGLSIPPRFLNAVYD